MRLALATDNEKRQRDRLTYVAWGDHLGQGDFALREERLRAHPWAREAMSTWILFEDRDQPVASCETFRMHSVLRGARGACHGVASVFVEERLRGRGYALRMMQLLCPELQARDPEAHAAILFSDVGASLYERAGYVLRPAADVVFPPKSHDEQDVTGVELLSDSDVPQVMRAATPPEGDFLVWPSAAQIDWHRERERVYAQLLCKPAVRPAGATCGRSVILWAADLKHDRLYVLYLSAETGGEAEALLRSARTVAGQSGLGEVRMWECPLPCGSLGPQGDDGGGVRQVRTESLPMIRPFVPAMPAVAVNAWNWIPKSIWV
jgi:predicted N-acetyltransferase YhbS